MPEESEVVPSICSELCDLFGTAHCCAVVEGIPLNQCHRVLERAVAKYGLTEADIEYGEYVYRRMYS